MDELKKANDMPVNEPIAAETNTTPKKEKLVINIRKLEKLEPTGPEPRPTGG